MNASNSRVSRPLREARGSSSSRWRVECESRAGRVRVGCGSRLVLATLAVICTVDGAIGKTSADQEIRKSNAIVHNLWKIWRPAPSGTGSYSSR